MERFMGFTDVSADRTSSSLAEHIFYTLGRYDRIDLVFE